MFSFKKKEPPKPVIQPTKEVDPDLALKVQVLQNLVLEQRSMIRGLLEIVTMLSEHKKYDLIRVKLDKVKNQLDKIK